MIETRYRIEYVDPNSNKLSSKLGKFLIYSALTISIFAATIALIFSNLPNSTAQIVTDKVQHFFSSFNNSAIDPIVAEEAMVTKHTTVEAEIEENTQIVDNDKSVQQALITTQLKKEHKEKIAHLSQENKTLHNDTAKQIQSNQTLSKKLDKLSKQLKEEKQKSTQLTKKLATLSTENKAVSALLKETNKTAKSYADELKKIKQKETEIVDAVKPLIIISKSNTAENISEEIVKEITIDQEKINTKGQKTHQVSQMDAIVAAMEAASNTSNTQNTKANNSNEKK
jgi:uncharacterized phage infection (PIP) family protein YhgE